MWKLSSPGERTKGSETECENASKATGLSGVTPMSSLGSHTVLGPSPKPNTNKTRLCFGGSGFLQLSPGPGMKSAGGGGRGRQTFRFTRQNPKLSLQFKQPPAMWKLGRGLKPGPFVKHIGFQTGILTVTIQTFTRRKSLLGVRQMCFPSLGSFLQTSHVNPRSWGTKTLQAVRFGGAAAWLLMGRDGLNLERDKGRTQALVSGTN